jgi:hypothetical protein
MVVGDVDDPGPPADLKTANGNNVPGIQLSLGEATALLGIRHRHRERGRAQQDQVTSEAV